MTVELGGFWRKPTDVEEHFFEEVPRRRKHDSEKRGSSEGVERQFWLVLEELDEKVLAEEVGV
jgi:hypothetical protein